MTLVVTAAFAGAASAAPINYGDFSDIPPGAVMYLDVTESSATDPVPPALFGAPTITGNELDFNPTAFAAASGGGTPDITDGQLNFGLSVVESRTLRGISSLLVSESGQFFLSGVGTTLTSVAAGVSVRIDILEVDGVAIDPIEVLASNSLVRNLESDGPAGGEPWSLSVLIEFLPVLATHGIEAVFGVTHAEVVINNQLLATSENGTEAVIDKGDFTIRPNPDDNPVIPEPTSAAVLFLTALAGVARRRRRA